MKTIIWALALAALSLTSLSFANNLVNTSRDLVSFNGTGANGTLSFDQTMMYSKFCNNVSQWYIYNTGTLASTGLGLSTLMYCEWLPMTMENAFQISAHWDSAIISGDSLIILTTGKNTFVFKQHIVVGNDKDSHGCIWSAGYIRSTGANACVRPWEEKTTPTICTMEYAPVCGSKQVQCIKAPCDPIIKTYGNICQLNADGATFVSSWECLNTNTWIDTWSCTVAIDPTNGKPMIDESTGQPLQVCPDSPIVGGDKDMHGCIGSAWYTRSQSSQQCVRVREQTGASV